MKINHSETEIKGSWVNVDSKLVADECALRIEKLISEQLNKLGSDESGWDSLYVDPDDGRFWELLYIDSDSHGGGAPTLRIISEEAAKKKYQDAFHD